LLRDNAFHRDHRSRYDDFTDDQLLVTLDVNTYGRGGGVGRGLGGGLDLGVGVRRGVAVGVVVAVAVGVAVGVGVGVGVGVPLPAGPCVATIIGDPVLKKPTVAFAFCGS
jgi:hypothetical protein